MKKQLNYAAKNNANAEGSARWALISNPLQQKIDNSQRVVAQQKRVQHVQAKNSVGTLQRVKSNAAVSSASRNSVSLGTGVVQRMLPELSEEFIAEHTSMTKEILLHAVKNWTPEERKETDEHLSAGPTKSTIEKTIANSDKDNLFAWYGYIRNNTPKSKLHVSSIESSDKIDLSPEQIEEVRPLIKEAYEDVLRMIKKSPMYPQKSEEHIKSIFGPDCNVPEIMGVYRDIAKKLFDSFQNKTSLFYVSSKVEHDMWVSNAGMASFNNSQFEMSDKIYKNIEANREAFFNTLVHELSHIVRETIVDKAYALDKMGKLTSEQRAANAETYAQAFLESLSTYTKPKGKSVPKRHYDASQIVDERMKNVSAGDALKKHYKMIQENATEMWNMLDNAYNHVKNILHPGYKITDLDVKFIQTSIFPHKMDIAAIKKYPNQVRALVEDRTRQVGKLKNRSLAIQALKASGLTKEDLEASDNYLASFDAALSNVLHISKNDASSIRNRLAGIANQAKAVSK